jgi:hypothetical protein
MKYCVGCGTGLPEHSVKFCPVCGVQLGSGSGASTLASDLASTSSPSLTSRQILTREKRRNARIVQAAGGVLWVIFGILAGVGTTSGALFAFYIVMIFAGLGLVAYGQKLYRNSI